MARETRRQRRDARRAAADQGGGGITRPPRLRTAEAGGPGPDGGSRFDAGTAPILSQRAGRRQWFSFVRESWAELRKVEWPSRAQVIQGTVVVLIACAIVGVFLYGADQAIRPLVKHVFLGQ